LIGAILSVPLVQDERIELLLQEYLGIAAFGSPPGIGKFRSNGQYKWYILLEPSSF
jgi:hypothetical protein